MSADNTQSISNIILIDESSKYDVDLSGIVIKNVPFDKLHEVLYFRKVIKELNYDINSFKTDFSDFLLAYKYTKDYVIGINTHFDFIDCKISELSK